MSAATEDASSQGQRSGSPSPCIREIYKNGWLKKIPSSDRHPSPFNKAPKVEKIWVVFCIHEETEPFLEYYENRRSAYSHCALHSYSLRQCLHISPTILIQEDDHEFAVTLGTQVLRLAAPTQEMMLEWLDVLGNKLRELGILESKDNVYSREPTSGSQGPDPLPLAAGSHSHRTDPDSQAESPTISSEAALASGRDPNSPLPPIPRNLFLPPVEEPLPGLSGGTTTYVRTPRSPLQHPLQSSSQQQRPSSVFNFDFVSSSLYETSREIQTAAYPNGSLYESLYRSREPQAARSSSFMHSGSSTQGANSSQLSRRRSEGEDPRSQGHSTSLFSVRRPLRGSGADLEAQQPAEGPPLEQGPPPYEPHRYPSSLTEEPHNNNLNRNSSGASTSGTTIPLTLKEQQVMTLQKEIAHRGGVRLMLRKRDCVDAIALVEAYGSLWVAGWRQKDHPLLHNTFHIGDKLLTIAGHPVSTVQEAQKALKSQPLLVEFVVQRVPYGRVFAIKRDFEGQDLGLLRDGNTAEVKEVRENSLVSRHGLPELSPTVQGDSLCSWTLTEVNGRPLNLFSKDNQVSERLNAVGRDISILVQPTDLVRNLKKQLKSFRSYKDYIVQ